MENVQQYYGVHSYFICVVYLMCAVMLLWWIFVSVLSILLIALVCSLRKVILKCVEKIQCVIVISISDTLCAHRSFVYVWFE